MDIYFSISPIANSPHQKVSRRAAMQSECRCDLTSGRERKNSASAARSSSVTHGALANSIIPHMAFLANEFANSQQTMDSAPPRIVTANDAIARIDSSTSARRPCAICASKHQHIM